MTMWLRRKPLLMLAAIATVVFVIVCAVAERKTVQQTSHPGDGSPRIELPVPRTEGRVSVEAALRARRSIREFQHEPLTLEQASQLLWSAQGITHPEGKRAAPSAGALYPLEVYLAAGDVAGLDVGIYKYQPREHQLLMVAEGDLRALLARAALKQDWMAGAPAIFLIAAVYERTARKYGERAQRYCHLEAGHAAENLALQAVALELGTAMVGAFDDQGVQRLAKMPAEEQVLYLIPTGRPR